MILKPKGTKDIYNEESILYKQIETLIDELMRLYNIEYIRTPIFEYSELFSRGVGESTDIVTKETYDFKDRGDRDITLRPEGTAAVARSVIENKLYGNRSDVLKYYYFGTMYRYERPQKGRYREFTQFGIEFYNSNSILVDAEVISIGYNLFQELGFENLVVEINTLGDKLSRESYKKTLIEYLEPNLDKLCSDCQNRFTKNPLRIIDCKVDKDSEVLKNIPKTIDYLSDESKKELNELENLLINMEVNYKINPKIVRGLDYYTGVVFEFIDDNVELGGGGRYDNLVKELNGPDLNATGFALGIDRIINKLLENDQDIKKEVDVFILGETEEEKYYSLVLSQNLRLNGVVVENSLNSLSIKSQFRLADKLNTKFLIILNNEDLQKGLITIKDNALKEEIKIDESEIVDYILQNI